MPKNYTVQEAAEFFRRDDKTIRRWIAEERFPNATKIVDGWLIPEKDMMALFESGKNLGAGNVSILSFIKKVILLLPPRLSTPIPS